MFVVTIEDAIAIHRAHRHAGDDTAIVEVRRRWPGLAERVHWEVLDRIMRMKIEVPTIPASTNPPAPGSPESDAAQRMEVEWKRRARERDREKRERKRAGRECR